VPEPKLNTISTRAARATATWALPEAPDAAELAGMYRMRRLIEPELSAKACLLHTDAEYDELEAHLTYFLDATADADEIYRAHRAFHTRLLAPAATAPPPSSKSRPSDEIPPLPRPIPASPSALHPPARGSRRSPEKSPGSGTPANTPSAT